MYGALIVEDEDALVVDEERVMMIDDMKLTSRSEFKRGNWLQRWIERHDGREGETLLINGKERPVIQMSAALHFHGNGTRRFRHQELRTCIKKFLPEEQVAKHPRCHPSPTANGHRASG